MTITADDFVNRVLAAMPTATPRRDQIAMELRGHISERLASGQSLQEVLDQLGDPVALAESYLSAVPLIAGDCLVACDGPADRLWPPGRAAGAGGRPHLVCDAASVPAGAACSSI